MKTVEEVLQLYREKYFDFNVQDFHEKLRELHGIDLSYRWVKTALQTAGLVKRRKKPGSQRKRRPRRPLAGMMLHIDGSEFSEEFSCIYFPQQYFTAGYRLELHADHPAHDKKDIIAFVLIVDDPLVTGCSTPGTLTAS